MYRTISPPDKKPARLCPSGGEWIQVRHEPESEVIENMIIIPEELSAGKMISLGELGTFCVNVKSEGAETVDGFVPSMVTGKRIVYRPTKGLRDKLHLMKVSLAN